MTIRLAPVGVMPGLRRRDDKGARFDRASTLQQVPMRAPRGHGERRRMVDRIATAPPSSSNSAGKRKS